MPSRGRLLAAALALIAGSALAQERGFAVHRLDPSAAGSRTFLVDRPWYSSTFAAGLTADYGHRVLAPQLATGRGEVAPIISDAVLGHVDLAGALFDRIRVALSLPITFFEAGTPELVSGAAPLRAIGVSDPRIGLMLRLFGDASRDALSLHVGLDAWIPIGGAPRHLGDVGPRFMPRLVAAGSISSAGRWTFEGAFLFRPYASLGPPALGMTAASELRLGLAAGLSLLDDRLYLGPEARFRAQVISASAFRPPGMELELLAGASVWLGGVFMIGAAAGTSVFSAAGAPDARAVLRLAFVPRSSPKADEPAQTAEAPVRDADADGVADANDRCPFEPETPNQVRDTDGCPEFEGDAGVALARVLVRDKPVTTPDAGPSLFFTADSDGDRVPDESDRCPLTREDDDGFEDEDGCPETDNDGDAVADAADRCPNEAETLNGFEDEDGCPDAAPDADSDGIADAVDRCPLEPESVEGVRDEDGCPEHSSSSGLARLLASGPARTLDADADSVDDAADRCPLTPEDPDQFEDEDGCPEPDNDEDGLGDSFDQCPLAAETFNGWKDDDGCPDEHGDLDADSVEYERDRCPLEPGDATDGCPHAPPPALALAGFSRAAPSMSDPAPANASTADFDRDGTPDDADPCPTTKEDRDGFEDEDGCPEPDNDRDGVDDAKDKCPFEAETINGNRDEDGCPDPGAAVVHVRKGAVVLDETVQFKTASATLQPVSLKLLKQVAAVLRAERTLSIEIQGHTDDAGSAATNIALSQKRAETIRAFLVKAGVAAARLVAKGYGPTRPRETNTTAAGREQNRRVEFLIIGEAK